MVTQQDCFDKYGDPHNHFNMILWNVPAEYLVGVIPRRIYCNKDIVKPLEKTFENLIITGHIEELKTWDGCYCIRQIRNGKGYSLHSWGIAVDVNAFENQMGTAGKLSIDFIKCFVNAGFINGLSFKRFDPMHFELKEI